MENEPKKKYEQAVEYLKSIGVKVAYQRVSSNPYFEDSYGKFNFSLIFSDENGNVFESYFSQSCVNPPYVSFSSKSFVKEKAKLEAENRYPDIFGALNCFCLDSDCLDYEFEEWSVNLGYDPDSRNAEKLYKACVEQTKGAIKVFDLEEIAAYLREIVLD